MTKKTKGYWIIGTANDEQAKEGKGLILWNTVRPKWFYRFMNKLLLSIRWVDKERELEKGKNFQTEIHKIKVKKHERTSSRNSSKVNTQKK